VSGWGCLLLGTLGVKGGQRVPAAAQQFWGEGWWGGDLGPMVASGGTVGAAAAPGTVIEFERVELATESAAHGLAIHGGGELR